MQTLFVLFAKVGECTEFKPFYVTQTAVRQGGKKGGGEFGNYSTLSSQKWAEMQMSVVCLGYGLDNRESMARFQVVAIYFSLLKRKTAEI